MNEENDNIITCAQCAACYDIHGHWGVCRLHGLQGAWVKMSDTCYHGLTEEDARIKQILIEP